MTSQIYIIICNNCHRVQGEEILPKDYTGGRSDYINQRFDVCGCLWKKGMSNVHGNV